MRDVRVERQVRPHEIGLLSAYTFQSLYRAPTFRRTPARATVGAVLRVTSVWPPAQREDGRFGMQLRQTPFGQGHRRECDTAKEANRVPARHATRKSLRRALNEQ